MRLTGSYFELTDRIADPRASKGPAMGPARGPNAAPVAGRSRPQAAGDGRSELLISVAKRLVKSAVRRNTVKRIVREAWRAATDNGSAQQRSQADGHPAGGQRDDGRRELPARAAGGTLAGQPLRRTCLVRLKRSPWAGAESVPSFAMIKRSLRQDADQLFATWRAKRK